MGTRACPHASRGLHATCLGARPDLLWVLCSLAWGCKVPSFHVLHMWRHCIRLAGGEAMYWQERLTALSSLFVVRLASSGSWKWDWISTLQLCTLDTSHQPFRQTHTYIYIHLYTTKVPITASFTDLELNKLRRVPQLLAHLWYFTLTRVLHDPLMDKLADMSQKLQLNGMTLEEITY